MSGKKHCWCQWCRWCRYPSAAARPDVPVSQIFEHAAVSRHSCTRGTGRPGWIPSCSPCRSRCRRCCRRRRHHSRVPRVPGSIGYSKCRSRVCVGAHPRATRACWRVAYTEWWRRWRRAKGGGGRAGYGEEIPCTCRRGRCGGGGILWCSCADKSLAAAVLAEFEQMSWR